MQRLLQMGVLSFVMAVCTAVDAQTVPLNQQKARVSPAWVTDGVMVQLWLRAFTPEGTLNAARQRLPHVAEAGFTIIYLSPICLMDDDPRKEHWAPRQRKTENPRNPYRIKDYERIDPEFGTREDLRAFVNEAHRLGLRVLMDIVYLHCGPSALLIERHPTFMKRDEKGNLKLANWGFPAIDFGKPEVHDYFWRNMEMWVRDFDIDGYRCDVSDGIPLAFWEKARERLEAIKPDIGMLAEGMRKEDQLKAFDLDYGWGAAFKTWDNAASIRALWETQHAARPIGGAKFVRFIENHDIVEDEGLNRLDKAWGIPRVNAVLAALFTLDGVPFLYNGQEFADVSRNSLYARLPIDWRTADTPAGQARLKLCRTLSALRRSEKALTRGGLTWLDNDMPAAVLSFRRGEGAGAVVSVINLSGKPVKARVNGVADSIRPLLAKGGAVDRQGVFMLEGFGSFIGRNMTGN